uniref:DUF4412 domain-containing protein n=1 Tax=Candidatus Kentrum sp. FW TaxID=2126338 RepID=A0A450ST94_9GAMM|nr:MAG: hypothetical protein BECKFW1821B_GA0114236_103210 [Candidatus Kentron sp. FW]
MHRGLPFFLRIISAAAILVFFVPMKAISGEVVEFSAEMVQRIPNQDSIPGRLYVAKDKIRMEAVIGENRRITIEDGSARKTLHLNPARKEYMEMPWPAAKPNQPDPSIRRPLPGDPNHPCAKRAQLKCKMLNKEEKIGNRKTEKWEIARVMQAGKQDARTIVIRSLVWVDRRLGVNVREERFLDKNPKGSSELRAIKEGLQPKTLFQVPEGYRRVEMPKTPSGALPGGGGVQRP